MCAGTSEADHLHMENLYQTQQLINRLVEGDHDRRSRNAARHEARYEVEYEWEGYDGDERTRRLDQP